MAKYPTHPPRFSELQILEIKTLIGWGYLSGYGYKIGSATWRMSGEVTAQVGFAVQYGPDETYLQFDYSYRKQPRTYRVNMEPRASNLGKGVIWFFRCPSTGQRCRKLYLYDGWFTHRKAVPGMYEAQTHSKRWRREKRVFDACLDWYDIEAELYQPNAKQTYRGKPTRRATRYTKKFEKLNRVSHAEVLSVLQS